MLHARIIGSVILLMACSVAVGCRIPDPIAVRTSVEAETVPAQDQSPIVQMPVGDSRATGGKVAIIDVDGLLVNQNQTGLMSVGTNPVADFRAKLDYARRHPDLCAVVVRIHSPGGGVTASDIMCRDLEAFRAETGRPVVACLMDVAAGGAYYLATASDLIVAHPTTVTGGFGVIMNLYNLQDMMAQMNIVGVPVKAGTQIDMGTPIRRIPDDSRQILQRVADEFQQRFHDRVDQTRGLGLTGDEAFLDGRILTAGEAESLGLVDSIGYLDDAVQLAGDQAGRNRSRPVLLHRCRDRAETPYAITPNKPIHQEIVPLDIPGLRRTDLPTFLYLWQSNP